MALGKQLQAQADIIWVPLMQVVFNGAPVLAQSQFTRLLNTSKGNVL